MPEPHKCPTNATRMLRCQHRHIERELAELEKQTRSSAPRIRRDANRRAYVLHGEECVRGFGDLVVALTAHLVAESTVFYAAAESALGRPLTEQRAQQEKLRDALQSAAGATESVGFPGKLSELAQAFRRHSCVEERAAHPSVEGTIGDQALDALGSEVTAMHAAVLATLRAA